MENRMISLERNTNETQIDLTLDLDGSGRYEIDTGCGFLNHMLELFARHGRFDLVLTCHGDVEVDYHHTTEDVGIALGQAFARALGDMRGIQRYGSFHLPMDEALILCAVDLSGRCTLNWDIHCTTEKVGDFDVECAKEFWLGFAQQRLFFRLGPDDRHKAGGHQLVHGVAKGTHAGQDEPVGFADGIGVGSDHRVLPQLCKAGFQAEQVAHAVINDRDHTSSPFVEGISSLWASSIFTAALSA